MERDVSQIVDMNLVRDKATREPKGVAFMWFRTRASVSLRFWRRKT